MWPFSTKKTITVPLFLTNTLSGSKDQFLPFVAGRATLYSCGPTVYGPQHIGNLRAAVFADTVARALKAAGYQLRRVINITDVGHLVGDGDEGEDKMVVGARAEKTTPKEIANRYTTRYLDDIKALNLDLSDIHFPRATEYIPQQIEMIKALEKKGLTYKTGDGIYFDTELFPSYGKLGNQKEVAQQAGTRVSTEGKKNPRDFALWRFAGSSDLQKWDSPWGEGNPGWSIECSAMSRALLGETIDVHTGGQDHISVHHNNEIAQSEGASGKPFVRYWLHNAFLTIEGAKISKSVGNVHTLSEVIERGFHPLALRYFFLQAHYRTPLSFSWEALKAAETGLEGLWKTTRDIKKKSRGKASSSPYAIELRSIFLDDLSTPQVLAALFKALGDDDLTIEQKWGLLTEADALLGLSLIEPPQDAHIGLHDLPEAVQSLYAERVEAKKQKDYARADELRIHIENSGYRVEDTASGPLFTRLER
ncbi:MAG: cysteine--tRNA ligase [Patescibacteria group bacterium]